MKKIRLIIMSAVVIIALAAVTPANAQFFKWGPRVGLNLNKLSFDKSVVTDNDNRAGFTGGLMVEFTVPVIGVGVDLSAMYVRRDARWMENNQVLKANRDYIDIPLNLKWKINIPAVNSIVRPFVTTGPSFSFLTSKTGVSQFFKNKKSDMSWNIGAGVELFKHLQVSASYGFGLGKSVASVVEAVTPGMLPGDGQKIEGKNRYWTVTAAWLF